MEINIQNLGRGWRHENVLSPPLKYFLLTVPWWYFFCGSFVFFVACVSQAFTSVHWKGLTSWLLLVMFIVFLLFPMWYPWSGVALD